LYRRAFSPRCISEKTLSASLRLMVFLPQKNFGNLFSFTISFGKPGSE